MPKFRLEEIVVSKNKKKNLEQKKNYKEQNSRIIFEI